MKNQAKQTVILVPGFCEPRPLMWPLGLALAEPSKRRRYGGMAQSERKVQIWQDRAIFRVLDRSIHKLEQHIASLLREEQQTIAIVTHSFGDWVARQAIARLLENDACLDPTRLALVSIAPIMTASPIAKGLRMFTCGLISEVAVMSDSAQASLNVTFGTSIARLVIWANADVWIEKVGLQSASDVQVQCVWATHLSIVLQPGVQRRVKEFVNEFFKVNQSNELS